ncbi:Yip1 family protein [Oceaniglobus indicus]|uniref:Yip1 family protein n=1 Tax=Oceaniglobus indicus TaxID=2047749 RepID=UPI000C179A38|nr:Yip1 family protein [Oceaniglobus indicus]
MMSLSVLLPMAAQTFRTPADVARRLMDMNLSRAVLWQALTLVVVISILLAEATNFIMLSAVDVPEGVFVIPPLTMGLIQLSLLIAMVFAIFWVGRAMGGTGRFQDGLVAVVWLQFIMVCLQVVQTVSMLILPAIAWLVGIFGLVAFLWLLTHFIATVHGFTSLGKVFAMIIATSFGAAFGLSLLLTLVGVTIPGMV